MFNRIVKTIEGINLKKAGLEYFTSPKFIVSVMIILIALIILIIVHRAFALILKKSVASGQTKLTGVRKQDKKTLPHVLEKLISYIVVFLAALAVLQVNGINVTSLVASLGLASAIVGLALQDYLKDVIMGVHILTDKFFSVGDVVRYNGKDGIVISFNMKTTKIQSLDDFSILSVSNRKIDEIAKVTDFMKINIPLSYDEDPQKVHSVLGGLTEKIKEIEEVKTAVYKGTFEFQDSSILYRINYYCDPKEKWGVWYKVMKIVQEGLAENNITIPYNQLDIHQYKE